jgi:dimeric dUTPase (all-alpha-NTP-PPase superfamily)
VLNLTELLETQKKLQASMGNPTGFGEAGFKENLLQAVVEVTEALRETNFKPWKTKKITVDRVKLATELTDILQFWANASLAMGLTPEELSKALRDKWQVNQQRIKDHEVTSS